MEYHVLAFGDAPFRHTLTEEDRKKYREEERQKQQMPKIYNVLAFPDACFKLSQRSLEQKTVQQI